MCMVGGNEIGIVQWSAGIAFSVLDIFVINIFGYISANIHAGMISTVHFATQCISWKHLITITGNTTPRNEMPEILPTACVFIIGTLDIIVIRLETLPITRILPSNPHR